uniref:Uncharacterized protein n=1 Tax=Lactuca sativa TaxID=4236 RepID=A0A9R1W563_LACSA|nr:hypothetical protein LSAT_V11C300149210 [Lactuca sativa]
MNRPMIRNGQAKDDTNDSQFNNRAKSIIVVNSRLLATTICHMPRLVLAKDTSTLCKSLRAWDTRFLGETCDPILERRSEMALILILPMGIELVESSLGGMQNEMGNPNGGMEMMSNQQVDVSLLCHQARSL